MFNKWFEGDEIKPLSAMQSSVRGTGEKGINILSGEPEEMRPFGKPALYCEKDIKIDEEPMTCVKMWIWDTWAPTEFGSDIMGNIVRVV